MYDAMMVPSRATAAMVGLACGLAAMGFLPAAGLALLVGAAAVVWHAFRTPSPSRSATMAGFLGQPVRFEHAIVWCVALVAGAVLAAAWR